MESVALPLCAVCSLRCVSCFALATLGKFVDRGIRSRGVSERAGVLMCEIMLLSSFLREYLREVLEDILFMSTLGNHALIST